MRDARGLATTIAFSGVPLVAQLTTVKSVHLTELRTAVNAVRVSAGLVRRSGPILHRRASGLRLCTSLGCDGLDAALGILGLLTVGYSDPLLTANTTVVKAFMFTSSGPE